MSRYAVINNESRKVVNVVIWEGAEWLPPRNHLVVPCKDGGIGWYYHEDKNAFTPPPPKIELPIELPLDLPL